MKRWLLPGGSTVVVAGSALVALNLSSGGDNAAWAPRWLQPTR